MSATSSLELTVPGSIQTLVAAGPGGEAVPRAAWPVVWRPSWRAERRSRSQVVNTPLSTSARRWLAIPSPSNGFERSPRERCGSSTIVIASGNIRSPSRSLRKLVPRAIAGPDIDPSKWEIKLRATRGSNTTGQRQVGGKDGAGEIIVALHAGSRAADHARADAVA